METFDFDRQLRRMELANTTEEVEQLSQEIQRYITSVPELKDERTIAWKSALARQRERSAIELDTFRELIGKPVTV